MKNILKVSLVALAIIIGGTIVAQEGTKRKQEPAKKNAKQHASHPNKKNVGTHKSGNTGAAMSINENGLPAKKDQGTTTTGPVKK